MTVLFTVVENLAIDVPHSTAFMDKHIHAILLEKQKVAVWKSTPVVIVKQNDMTANAVLTKRDIFNMRT